MPLKITIESTDDITRVNGISCRVWFGTTESGIPVALFIHRIMPLNSSDEALFARELTQTKPPREVELIDVLLRHAL